MTPKNFHEDDGIMQADEFKQLTGREPVDDDLERVNCNKAGMRGHRSCGWCFWCEKPKFECVCKTHDREGRA